MMRKIKKRSDCPISYSLDLLGDKWTMLILRDMGLNDKHFYKDFLEAGEGVATNVLADRLKMLETYGIIKSEQYQALKTKKYYTLTEKGIELLPVIVDLWAWGAKHDPETTVSKEELHHRLSKKDEIIEHYTVAARKSQFMA